MAHTTACFEEKRLISFDQLVMSIYLLCKLKTILHICSKTNAIFLNQKESELNLNLF